MRKRTMSLLLGFCIAAGMGHASPAGAVNSEIDLSKMQPVVMILPTSANIGMMRGISILDANMIDALEGGTCTAYLQSGGTVDETEQSYCGTATDESAVNVTNSGAFTLSDSTITGSGNTSSPDNSSFYGLNAGVLASSSSTIDLSNCTVSTTGTGANGVFATGTGSSVTLSDVIINCTGQLAHGVDAIGSPAPVDYNGQLDVLVASGDHAVWWDMFDGTKWSGWNYLGGFTPSAPGVASYTPGG